MRRVAKQIHGQVVLHLNQIEASQLARIILREDATKQPSQGPAVSVEYLEPQLFEIRSRPCDGLI